MAAEWQRARELHATIARMGNTDSDLSQTEYAGKLEGGFLEGLMGKSWSIETWSTWAAAMTRYHTVVRNTAAPKLVVLNAQGRVDNYQFMRYALASALMDDGYFCYTDTARGYSSVPWFDEYDAALGVAVDTPQTQAWQNGVFRRLFAGGAAFVNPKGNGTRKVYVGAGYRRIQRTQDPAVNNGAVVTDSVTLPERDGIVLLRTTSAGTSTRTGAVPVLSLSLRQREPFAGTMSIAYCIPGDEPGIVRIYAVSGALLHEVLVRGQGTLRWNASREAAGASVCVLTAGNCQTAGQVTTLR